MNYHDLIRLLAIIAIRILQVEALWIFDLYELIIIALESDQSIELFLEFKYRVYAQYMRLNKSVFCIPY